MKRLPAVCCITALLLSSFITYPGISLGKDGSSQDSELEKANWLYQHENYEEALVLFKALKEKEPQSAIIEYFLGITYKQLQDYAEAKPHLEAALTLQPRVLNAFPELITLLYQMDQIDEAKKWLELAEKEGMNPAQTAFLKGLVLLREAKDPDGARLMFEEARTLDSSLAGTAKYFEAFCYMQSKRLSEARNIFQDIITRQPTSDMAYFANEYMSAISRREDAEKPLRASVGYAWQYDNNVLLAPDDASLSTGVGNKGDWRQATTLDGQYRFKLGDVFSLTPGYSFYWAKQSDLGFYDMVSHDLSLQPAFVFKDMSSSFPVHFNYLTVNDKGYLGMVGVSNLNNIAIGRNQMLQTVLQYNRKNFLWTTTFANDNRDSNEGLASLGWFYFFGKEQEGFANMRYTFNHDDTRGINWDYYGNRFSLSSAVPVTKFLRLNMAADYFVQDYWKTNSVYEKKRTDNILTLSSLVAVEVAKDVEVQLQYVFVDDASTIGIYKYKRQLYSVGMKYNF